MLYFCLAERRDFGDLISPDNYSRLTIQRSAELDGVLQEEPRGRAILAVWSQKPEETGQLPDLVVCPDGTEEDWAAWITTFATRIRPFSAYIRLVTYAEMLRIARSLQPPSLGPLTWPVAGLILGEVLAALGFPDRALEIVPAAVCASTLSFAMFRAVALFPEFDGWLPLVTAWELVRKATRQRPRAIDGSSVASVCSVIMAAAGIDRGADIPVRKNLEVVIACRELIRSPARVPSSLAASPHFAAIEGRMNGPREDSVVAFGDFARATLRSASDNAELTALFLGYLASRIAPGTLRHLSVLAAITHRYPTAILWYGFCAGFGDADGGAPWIRRAGLDLPPSARRVVRDLLRPEASIGPPSCDISFLELMALARTSDRPLDGLITMTQGTVTVELAMGIWTAINTASKETLSDNSGHVMRDREIRAMIGECIERLSGAYKELGSNELPSQDGTQHSLFPTKRKKR